MPTLSSLTQRSIERLSQVTGTGVQRYAEDRIANIIKEKYLVLCDEFWFPEQMQWFTRTLDGAAGLVTVNLDEIKSVSDIRAIFPENYRTNPLMKLPLGVNPYSMGTGSFPRFFEPYNEVPGKLFRCWPLQSNINLNIHAQIVMGFDEITPNTEIKIDDVILVQAACYDYLEDDGTNSGATEKFLQLYNDRFDQLTARYSKDGVALNGRSGYIPDTWR